MLPLLAHALPPLDQAHTRPCCLQLRSQSQFHAHGPPVVVAELLLIPSPDGRLQVGGPTAASTDPAACFCWVPVHLCAPLPSRPIRCLSVHAPRRMLKAWWQIVGVIQSAWPCACRPPSGSPTPGPTRCGRCMTPGS